MTESLKQYLDRVFKGYESQESLVEFKEELLQNLKERLQDLKAQGYDEATALQLTIDSVGDVSELLQSVHGVSRPPQPAIEMNLSMSNLQKSDLRAVAVHDGKFNYSNLRNSDFTDADLTDSTFKRSNLENVKFDRAVLRRAKFSASNLKGASFNGTVLDGTDFSYSNLSDVCFDGLRLSGTVFNNAGLKGTSFRQSTLISVSFKTNVKKAVFDGAIMDKLTYAILQGYGAKLNDVTVM